MLKGTTIAHLATSMVDFNKYTFTHCIERKLTQLTKSTQKVHYIVKMCKSAPKEKLTSHVTCRWSAPEAPTVSRIPVIFLLSTYNSTSRGLHSLLRKNKNKNKNERKKD